MDLNELKREINALLPKAVANQLLQILKEYQSQEKVLTKRMKEVSRQASKIEKPQKIADRITDTEDKMSEFSKEIEQREFDCQRREEILEQGFKRLDLSRTEYELEIEKRLTSTLIQILHNLTLGKYLLKPSDD